MKVGTPLIDSRVRAGAALEVSVVICTYTMDRWTDLERAVESVPAQPLR